MNTRLHATFSAVWRLTAELQSVHIVKSVQLQHVSVNAAQPNLNGGISCSQPAIVAFSIETHEEAECGAKQGLLYVHVNFLSLFLGTCCDWKAGGWCQELLGRDGPTRLGRSGNTQGKSHDSFREFFGRTTAVIVNNDSPDVIHPVPGIIVSLTDLQLNPKHNRPPLIGDHSDQ